MLVKKLIAGSVFAIAAGNVAAVPSDLADLNNDAGTTLFPDVPEDTYFDTRAGYVSLTDTSGVEDDTNATLLAESAALESGNSFGIFNPTSGEKLEVFSGSDSAIAGETVSFNTTTGIATHDGTGASADIGVTFGFFIDNGLGNVWYSDPAMNGGDDFAGLYDTTGTSGEGLFGSDILVAFEDTETGDRDYNDVVVGLTDVAAVPEPGTLALMGMGILGLGVSRLRKS
ncbi:PEP-CTERM sorting domain-containing protein [Marinobacter sp. TBZ242]|uniref:PEP-CTERM sorting domain-containing protein n=1 Tax=Marinobacter azerbaijanicus TaxID=3050455 RepID=A0ABT7I9I0_9GAMM|nr:PEP-CTERM sorting domain-containing protein [Marinobacter sp. TBZ242]MDL0430796.1 PEP-CTERM sorting domain-containing protein [Marinobacter sp. TBZ242]